MKSTLLINLLFNLLLAYELNKRHHEESNVPINIEPKEMNMNPKEEPNMETINLTIDNYNLTETKSSNDKVIVGYYADWKASELIPEKIPYDKLTHINYSFAMIKESTSEPYIESETILPRVVKEAHNNNVKVLLSVGGWTGSKSMSNIFADKDKRKVFIDKLVELVQKFELDGIDIDWEFPGRMGMACNIINPQVDSNNFITLLRELRGNFDAIFKNNRKLITLAVRVEPIDGPNGPLKDTTDLANMVDFVNVMAYDINGPWSSVSGPNAPLRHTTGTGFQLSYMSGVMAWLNSKFPKDKLVMGLAFYGRSFIINQEIKTSSKDKNKFYVPFSKSIPQGDQQDAMWSDPCPGAPYTYSGVWQWKNLRSQGLLKEADLADTSLGWERHFDEISMTPWLYNSQKKLLISYDDPQSLKHKVEYTKCNDLKGVMIWALHEDNMELLNSIQGIRTNESNNQCQLYQKIDDTQNNRLNNRTLAINPTPYHRGSFGLMYAINRHAKSSSYKTIPLPDKIFSS